MKAAFEAMTDFVNLTLTISASGVNSCNGINIQSSCLKSKVRTQMAENARRSTKGRREHKLVPSSEGNMSMRLSTRYTVVPRSAASLSIGVSAWTKCETSAISGTTVQSRGLKMIERNTHERQPQYFHWVEGEHVKHRQYLGNLRNVKSGGNQSR